LRKLLEIQAGQEAGLMADRARSAAQPTWTLGCTRFDQLSQGRGKVVAQAPRDVLLVALPQHNCVAWASEMTPRWTATWS
jgi:hypothetical protein